MALHRGPLLFEDHSPRLAGERFGQVHYAFHVPRDLLEAAVTHVRAAGVRRWPDGDLDKPKAFG